MLSAEAAYTETMIIQDITKTDSSNCFILHCLKKITKNALCCRNQSTSHAVTSLNDDEGVKEQKRAILASIKWEKG